MPERGTGMQLCASSSQLLAQTDTCTLSACSSHGAVDSADEFACYAQAHTARGLHHVTAHKACTLNSGGSCKQSYLSLDPA